MFFETAVITAIVGGSMLGFTSKAVTKQERKVLTDVLGRILEEQPVFNRDKRNALYTWVSQGEKVVVEIQERDAENSCVVYRSVGTKHYPVYEFSFLNDGSTIYDVKIDRYFVPSDNDKASSRILYNFKNFVVLKHWKRRTSAHQGNRIAVKDPEIQSWLTGIEERAAWLQDSGLLQVEEGHKVDVLVQDGFDLCAAYSAFRDETKTAFKGKVVTGLQEILGKLNQLANTKEEEINSRLDKTLLALRER